MNHYRTDPFASAGPLLVVVAILTCAAMVGIATAMVGGRAADYKALYYIGLFGLGVAGGLVAITRPDPLRFSFLVLILAFPFAGYPIPPARFGFALFDVVMVVLVIGLIGRRVFASAPAAVPVFPSASLAIASLLFIPCIVFSLFPFYSLLALVQSVALYGFFLLALEELGRKNGLERLVALFSIVLLALAAGLFVDHFLHINLSLRGSNLNQSFWVDERLLIYRAAGFFQDPQKAAAFLGCMITFLLVLSLRGRLRGAGLLRYLVWAAILVGLAALLTTVSRGAIAACVFVSALALFAFNGWGAAAKLISAGVAMVAASALALTPDVWLGVVPTGLVDRFLASRVEFAMRMEIWLDTWRMFADQPYTGIGPGSFQQYLLATQPAIVNYYGIGEASGVAYVPDQPESGYLKILYEGGICGSLAALVVAAAALTRALAVALSRNTDPDARSECIAALASLAVFAATFVTLFTVNDRRIAALFVFLLAVIWHRSLEHRARAAPKA